MRPRRFANVPVPPSGAAHYRVEGGVDVPLHPQRVHPDHDHDDHSDAVRRNARTWDQADAVEIAVPRGNNGQSLRKDLWIQGIDIPGDVYP